jgi:hypothetical protein
MMMFFRLITQTFLMVSINTLEIKETKEAGSSASFLEI